MFRCFTAAIGALAILFAALLLGGRAEAGGSASAPSKYTRSSQLVLQQGQNSRQAGRIDFGITEYSSSSARNRSH